MADQRSVLKEYRHLDEKLRTVGLSPQEEARWRELRDLVAPPEETPAAPGFDVNAAAQALKASLEPAGRRRPAAAPPAVAAPIEEAPSPEAAEGAAPLDAAVFGSTGAAEEAQVGTTAAGAAETYPEGQPFAEAELAPEAAQAYDAAAQGEVPAAEAYPEGQPFAEAELAPEAAQAYDVAAQGEAPAAEAYPEGQPFAEAELAPETAPAPPAEPSDAELQPWDPNAFPGAIDAAAFASGSPGLEGAGPGEGFPEFPGGTPLDASALPPVEPEQVAPAEAETATEEPQPDMEILEADAPAPGEAHAEEPAFPPAALEEPAPAEIAQVDTVASPEPAESGAPADMGGGPDTWESLTPPNVADAPPVQLASAADFLAEAAAAQSVGSPAPAGIEILEEPLPEGEPVDLDDLIIDEIPVVEAAEEIPAAAPRAVPAPSAPPPVAPAPVARAPAPAAAPPAPRPATPVPVAPARAAPAPATPPPAATPAPPAPRPAAAIQAAPPRPPAPPAAPPPAAVPVVTPLAPPSAKPSPSPSGLPAHGGLSPSFFPGTHRVVVHTVEGQVKRGELNDVELDAPAIPLEVQPGGGVESIPASRIKAVFFMLAPGEAPPVPEGKKVRVIFRDGRQVAGYSPDYDPHLTGFFMLPADTRTNTARIWVYREAVREVAVS